MIQRFRAPPAPVLLTLSPSLSIPVACGLLLPLDMEMACCSDFACMGRERLGRAVDRPACASRLPHSPHPKSVLPIPTFLSLCLHLSNLTHTLCCRHSAAAARVCRDTTPVCRGLSLSYDPAMVVPPHLRPGHGPSTHLSPPTSQHRSRSPLAVSPPLLPLELMTRSTICLCRARSTAAPLSPASHRPHCCSHWHPLLRSTSPSLLQHSSKQPPPFFHRSHHKVTYFVVPFTTSSY